MAAMPRRMSSPQLIGRAEEVDRLRAALNRAIAGDPGAVLIAGEAGVGKTRLVEELAVAAASDGVQVLVGECIEVGGEDLPFTPLVSALRSVAGEVGEDELRELAGPAWFAVARLVPSLAAAGEASDEMSQARLFELLVGLLNRLARERPLLLVVEDLHWADQSTRDFLTFLLRQLRAEPMMLVCTYRSDELNRRHPLRPLLAQALRLAVVERIELHTLSYDELANLVEAIRGEAPTPHAVERLFQRSEGNPFFAEELLATNTDVDGRLPETLRDVLALRLDGLTANAESVLGTAAVAGRPISESLIAAVTGLDAGSVREALLELDGAQLLISRDHGHAFRHALVREVVTDDLLPGERQALHLALGDALEQRPDWAASTHGADGEAAYHWFSAHDNTRALPALLRAGNTAMELAAFAEAARTFALALELWGQIDDPSTLAGCDHVELLRLAGAASSMAGDARALEFAQQALAELGSEDPLRRAGLLNELGAYAWEAGDLDAARNAHQEAVDLLPPTPPSEQRAHAVAQLASLLMVTGQDAEARTLAQEAIEIARAVGARRVEGHASNTLGVVIAEASDVNEGMSRLRFALDVARDVAAGEDVMRAYNNLGHVLGEAGAYDECLAIYTEALETGKQLGLERSRNALIAASAAHVHLLRGEHIACDSLVDYALGLDPPPESESYALGVRAAARIVRGDLGGGEADLESARDRWGRDADVWLNCAPIAIGQIGIALQRRDFEAAHAVALQGLEVPDGASCRQSQFGTLAWAARAEADRAEYARDLRDAHVERDAIATGDAILARITRPAAAATHLGPPGAHAALAAAEVARAHAEADTALWRKVVLSFDEFQPPLAAYARWRLAEAMLQSDAGRAEAAGFLRDAAEAAARLGDVALQRETQALARRARISLDAVHEPAETLPPAAGIIQFGLTEREAEVLPLIAEGLTNREIAARLFIAEKTASVHVSRILSKVGARSRVEAAGIAHRLGLVPQSTDPK